LLVASAEDTELTVQDRIALTVIYLKKTKIIPLFDLEAGFRYPEAEDAFGLLVSQTLDKLDQLSRLGYLHRVLYSTMLKCPVCNEFKLFLALRCPKCNSSVLQKGQSIKHYACGYDGFEEEFEKEGSYLCPKCNNELDKLGVDYRKIGAWYKCLDCGDFFGEPLEKLNCFTCNKEFVREDCILQPVWGYEIVKDRLKDVILDIELDALKQAFEDKYNVDVFTRIKGLSGIGHVFTFTISSRGPILKEVVIDMEYSKQPVNQEPVMRFFAKTVDTKVAGSILIAIPGLDELAKKLSNGYNLTVIESSSLSATIPMLKQMLAERLG